MHTRFIVQASDYLFLYLLSFCFIYTPTNIVPVYLKKAPVFHLYILSTEAFFLSLLFIFDYLYLCMHRLFYVYIFTPVYLIPAHPD